ncbi:hypothetical protein BESB_025230 [Besnoitia besnoiti]|uniref:Alpha/beta hydrolase family protein n=1 Tax=Besnoitia besnoiti TaxID=94643 RepID=A0A2A9M7D2_BESBE|nr:uncharacterized protein BESB_025230 [Besnoitia besnoiti]PFH31557.1 hypothetical protein BESB_025230 [Besnoitia besnoiti]
MSHLVKKLVSAGMFPGTLSSYDASSVPQLLLLPRLDNPELKIPLFLLLSHPRTNLRQHLSTQIQLFELLTSHLRQLERHYCLSLDHLARSRGKSLRPATARVPPDAGAKSPQSSSDCLLSPGAASAGAASREAASRSEACRPVEERISRLERCLAQTRRLLVLLHRHVMLQQQVLRRELVQGNATHDEGSLACSDLCTCGGRCLFAADAPAQEVKPHPAPKRRRPSARHRDVEAAGRGGSAGASPPSPLLSPPPRAHGAGTSGAADSSRASSAAVSSELLSGSVSSAARSASGGVSFSASAAEDAVSSLFRGPTSRVVSCPYLIIYAHGNGSDIGDIYSRSRMLSQRLHANFLLFDYPGYGKYAGAADEASVDLTLQSVLAFAMHRLHWPPQKIIFWGTSIGTGPCTRAARRLAGSVLLTQRRRLAHLLAAAAERPASEADAASAAQQDTEKTESGKTETEQTETEDRDGEQRGASARAAAERRQRKRGDFFCRGEEESESWSRQGDWPEREKSRTHKKNPVSLFLAGVAAAAFAAAGGTPWLDEDEDEEPDPRESSAASPVQDCTEDSIPVIPSPCAPATGIAPPPPLHGSSPPSPPQSSPPPSSSFSSSPSFFLSPPFSSLPSLSGAGAPGASLSPAFSSRGDAAAAASPRPVVASRVEALPVPGGLVLQCPYRSITHAATAFVPSLIARALVSSGWNVEKELLACDCPVLLIHGQADELFPWEGSLAMLDAYREVCRLRRARAAAAAAATAATVAEGPGASLGARDAPAVETKLQAATRLAAGLSAFARRDVDAWAVGHFPEKATHGDFDFCKDLVAPVQRLMKQGQQRCLEAFVGELMALWSLALQPASPSPGAGAVSVEDFFAFFQCPAAKRLPACGGAPVPAGSPLGTLPPATDFSEEPGGGTLLSLSPAATQFWAAGGPTGAAPDCVADLLFLLPPHYLARLTLSHPLVSPLLPRVADYFRLRDVNSSREENGKKVTSLRGWLRGDASLFPAGGVPTLWQGVRATGDSETDETGSDDDASRGERRRSSECSEEESGDDAGSEAAEVGSTPRRSASAVPPASLADLAEASRALSAASSPRASSSSSSEAAESSDSWESSRASASSPAASSRGWAAVVRAQAAQTARDQRHARRLRRERKKAFANAFAADPPAPPCLTLPPLQDNLLQNFSSAGALLGFLAHRYSLFLSSLLAVARERFPAPLALSSRGGPEACADDALLADVEFFVRRLYILLQPSLFVDAVYKRWRGEQRRGRSGGRRGSGKGLRDETFALDSLVVAGVRLRLAPPQTGKGALVSRSSFPGVLSAEYLPLRRPAPSLRQPQTGSRRKRRDTQADDPEAAATAGGAAESRGAHASAHGSPERSSRRGSGGGRRRRSSGDKAGRGSRSRVPRERLSPLHALFPSPKYLLFPVFVPPLPSLRSTVQWLLDALALAGEEKEEAASSSRRFAAQSAASSTELHPHISSSSSPCAAEATASLAEAAPPPALSAPPCAAGSAASATSSLSPLERGDPPREPQSASSRRAALSRKENFLRATKKQISLLFANQLLHQLLQSGLRPAFEVLGAAPTPTRVPSSVKPPFSSACASSSSAAADASRAEAAASGAEEGTRGGVPVVAGAGRDFVAGGNFFPFGWDTLFLHFFRHHFGCFLPRLVPSRFLAPEFLQTPHPAADASSSAALAAAPQQAPTLGALPTSTFSSPSPLFSRPPLAAVGSAARWGEDPEGLLRGFQRAEQFSQLRQALLQGGAEASALAPFFAPENFANVARTAAAASAASLASMLSFSLPMSLGCAFLLAPPGGSARPLPLTRGRTLPQEEGPRDLRRARVFHWRELTVAESLLAQAPHLVALADALDLNRAAHTAVAAAAREDSPPGDREGRGEPQTGGRRGADAEARDSEAEGVVRHHAAGAAVEGGWREGRRKALAPQLLAGLPPSLLSATRRAAERARAREEQTRAESVERYHASGDEPRERRKKHVASALSFLPFGSKAQGAQRGETPNKCGGRPLAVGDIESPLRRDDAAAGDLRHASEESAAAEEDGDGPSHEKAREAWQREAPILSFFQSSFVFSQPMFCLSEFPQRPVRGGSSSPPLAPSFRLPSRFLAALRGCLEAHDARGRPPPAAAEAGRGTGVSVERKGDTSQAEAARAAGRHGEGDEMVQDFPRGEREAGAQIKTDDVAWAFFCACREADPVEGRKRRADESPAPSRGSAEDRRHSGGEACGNQANCERELNGFFFSSSVSSPAPSSSPRSCVALQQPSPPELRDPPSGASSTTAPSRETSAEGAAEDASRARGVKDTPTQTTTPCRQSSVASLHATPSPLPAGATSLLGRPSSAPFASSPCAGGTLPDRTPSAGAGAAVPSSASPPPCAREADERRAAASALFLSGAGDCRRIDTDEAGRVAGEETEDSRSHEARTGEEEEDGEDEGDDGSLPVQEMPIRPAPPRARSSCPPLSGDLQGKSYSHLLPVDTTTVRDEQRTLAEWSLLAALVRAELATASLLRRSTTLQLGSSGSGGVPEGDTDIARGEERHGAEEPERHRSDGESEGDGGNSDEEELLRLVLGAKPVQGWKAAASPTLPFHPLTVALERLLLYALDQLHRYDSAPLSTHLLPSFPVVPFSSSLLPFLPRKLAAANPSPASASPSCAYGHSWAAHAPPHVPARPPGFASSSSTMPSLPQPRGPFFPRAPPVAAPPAFDSSAAASASQHLSSSFSPHQGASRPPAPLAGWGAPSSASGASAAPSRQALQEDRGLADSLAALPPLEPRAPPAAAESAEAAEPAAWAQGRSAGAQSTPRGDSNAVDKFEGGDALLDTHRSGAGGGGCPAQRLPAPRHEGDAREAPLGSSACGAPDDRKRTVERLRSGEMPLLEVPNVLLAKSVCLDRLMRRDSTEPGAGAPRTQSATAGERLRASTVSRAPSRALSPRLRSYIGGGSPGAQHERGGGPDMLASGSDLCGDTSPSCGRLSSLPSRLLPPLSAAASGGPQSARGHFSLETASTLRERGQLVFLPHAGGAAPVFDAPVALRARPPGGDPAVAEPVSRGVSAPPLWEGHLTRPEEKLPRQALCLPGRARGGDGEGVGAFSQGESAGRAARRRSVCYVGDAQQILEQRGASAAVLPRAAVFAQQVVSAPQRPAEAPQMCKDATPRSEELLNKGLSPGMAIGEQLRLRLGLESTAGSSREIGGGSCPDLQPSQQLAVQASQLLAHAGVPGDGMRERSTRREGNGGTRADTGTTHGDESGGPIFAIDRLMTREVEDSVSELGGSRESCDSFLRCI